MIINVEGGDKAGKETQSKRLVRHLESKGHRVLYRDYPQYDSFFGKMCKDYLNGEYGHLKDLPPRLTMLPYAMDRMKDLKVAGIDKYGKKYDDIVFNRYTYSNVFSISRLPEQVWEDEIRWLEELEFNQLGLPKPDLNFYLYLDPKIAYEMRNQGLKEYQNGKADIHEANISIQAKTSQVYKLAASLDKSHWVVVDEMLPDGNRMTIDNIFESIVKELNVRMKTKIK